jgi:hypothetical protein
MNHDKYAIPTRSEPHRNKLTSLRRRGCMPGMGALAALLQVRISQASVTGKIKRSFLRVRHPFSSDMPDLRHSSLSNHSGAKPGFGEWG